MLGRFASWPLRRRLLILAAAIAVAAGLPLIVFVGNPPRSVRSMPSDRGPRPSLSPSQQRDASAFGTLSRTPSAAVLPPLARTDDPEVYAREVATALFGVDASKVTRTEFLRFWQDEAPTVVYADAATKGLTLSAQDADVIDNLTSWWIPPPSAWASEAADRAVSSLAITSVSVPDYWVNSVADGTFRDPGLHMERVMGVLSQHYGTDPAHRYTAARSVVIDLGLLCGPTQSGGCRLVAPQPPPGIGDS
jgi:hypothetical protein